MVTRIFTFGFGQEINGVLLKDRYVRITAPTEGACRDIMFSKFGQRWSMMYPSEETAGVSQFGLKLWVDITDVGDTAVCDSCGKDWSGREDDEAIGGILFGSNAYCPPCTSRMSARIAVYGEERYVKDEARPGETYHAFIRRLRNGNNLMVISHEL